MEARMVTLTLKPGRGLDRRSVHPLTHTTPGRCTIAP
jgi:hypothetical protein